MTTPVSLLLDKLQSIHDRALLLDTPRSFFLTLFEYIENFDKDDRLTSVSETILELRIMFGNYDFRTWYRLVSDANNVRIPLAKDIFGLLRNSLNTFKPIRFVDFQYRMLNNDK